MADTKIDWCDVVWNPIVGCSRISAGCDNCYAARIAHIMVNIPQVMDKYMVVEAWDGRVQFDEKSLEMPLHLRKPKRVFVNSMGDLFHKNVPDEWIDEVFAVMALATQHTFLILTKRPERMLDYMQRLDLFALQETEAWRAASYRVTCDDDPNGTREWHDQTLALEKAINAFKLPLPNVWSGVSVEDQKTADERMPLLLQTPAAHRFVSVEPMLGAVDLTAINAAGWCECYDSLPTEVWPCHGRGRLNALSGWCYNGDVVDGKFEDYLEPGQSGFHGWSENENEMGLDWVICGGESGPGARPMHPDWARGLRDQCKAAGVPFFFKQWGEFKLSAIFDFCRCGKKAAGHLLDGKEHREIPA